MASIDTSSFQKFGSAMHKAAPKIKVVMSKALVDVAPEVVEKAKSLASFSTKIPGSIKVVPLDVGVMITAGGEAAPDADVFENKGKPGNFRHPLFGNKGYWYSQKAHPFLAPALVASVSQVEEAISTAMDTLLDEIADSTDL
jgi:hypothetical protein